MRIINSGTRARSQKDSALARALNRSLKQFGLWSLWALGVLMERKAAGLLDSD